MLDLAFAVVLTMGPVDCTPGIYVGPNDWCDTVDPAPEDVQEQLPEETQGRAIDPLPEEVVVEAAPAPPTTAPRTPQIPDGASGGTVEPAAPVAPAEPEVAQPEAVAFDAAAFVREIVARVLRILFG